MITIVLLVSRDFLLSQLFNRLDKLLCDRHMTNLLVLVDGEKDLYLKARNLTVASNFAQKLCVSAKPPKHRSPSQSFRRKRIAYLHNEAKTYIEPCEYILLLEDDGLFPLDGLDKLLKLYKQYPDAGFIEGLELGRWLSRYIGAWLVDDPFDVKEIRSIDYKPDTVISIDAGGLYFTLTRFSRYMDHMFAPTNNFGPDIIWGLELRKQGYTNYIDTSILVEHHNSSGRVFTIDKDPPSILNLKKRNGIWRTFHSVQKVR